MPDPSRTNGTSGSPAEPVPVREPAPPLPSRGSGVRGHLLTLLCAAIAVLLLEVGLRVARPELAPESGNILRQCHRVDPVTGWRPLPDCGGPFVKGDFATTISTNRHGLRGPDVAVAPGPGVRTVAILGDSWVWGFGVNDDETLSASLEPLLPATRVLNFGVCGFGTDQSYLYYREAARAFKPDVVVLGFFPHNDFGDNLAGRAAQQQQPYFAFDADGVLRAQNLPLPPRESILPPRAMGFDEIAQAHSYAYRFLYLQAKQFNARLKQATFFSDARAARRQRELAAKDEREPLPIYAQNPPPEVAESIRITLGILDLLHEAVAADGARLVVLAIPHRIQLLPDEWARALRSRNLDPALYEPGRPHALLAEWAAAHDVPVLDLYTALAREADLKSCFLPTDRHFSAEGFVRAATLLAPVVAGQLPNAVVPPTADGAA